MSVTGCPRDPSRLGPGSTWWEWLLGQQDWCLSHAWPRAELRLNTGLVLTGHGRILVIGRTFLNSQKWGNGLNHGKVVEGVQLFFYVNLLADTTEEYFSSEVLMKNISEYHKIN